MSLWLNLIPQLHQPGLEEMSMRHHHFQEEGAQYYDGSVRPQTLQRPIVVMATTTTTTTTTTTEATTVTTVGSSGEESTTECPPNATIATLAARPPQVGTSQQNNSLFISRYQSYTTALSVTIAVGCFLLLLNILIFAGIYHQRDRRSGNDDRKRKYDRKEDHSGGELSGSSSSEGADAKQAFAESLVVHHQHMVELQEFKCSPPSGSRGLNSVFLPSYPHHHHHHVSEDNADQQLMVVTSPSIPEPPPPPKAAPPPLAALTATVAANQAGILRTPTPQTPSAMKKRVQIQEISV